MSLKSGTLAVGVIIAMLLMLSVTTVGSETSNEGVFIHIKSGPDQSHAVLMGLQMAKIMAESKAVLVYIDVAGIDVLRKDAEELTMKPFGSSKQAIEDLISKGVSVMACPGCMKAKGVTEEDLLEGVQVAQKDAFFNFTQGRILSLTY